jgi:hypothetical protein
MVIVVGNPDHVTDAMSVIGGRLYILMCATWRHGQANNADTPQAPFTLTMSIPVAASVSAIIVVVSA